MNIGILALQGAFLEHEQMLGRMGIPSFEIRQKKDADRDFDALIIPGGESTVMGKLLRRLGLYEPLRSRIDSGMPVFGTCAGLILLAKKVSNHSNDGFACMDITAKRNAYGRQLDSFRTDSDFGRYGRIPMTFIRAPYIESVGKNVEVLSEVGGHIVAAREGNMLVTAFHPELNDDETVHRYFAAMAGKRL